MSRQRERHGMFDSPEYYTWREMCSRCFNPNISNYMNYGGRGITVCDRWRNSFLAFYEDMGKRPAGTNLDRIDNNSIYSPENCKWATLDEQVNNKRTNHSLEYNGKTMTMVQWSRRLGLKYKTLAARINDYHWPVERALGG